MPKEEKDWKDEAAEAAWAEYLEENYSEGIWESEKVREALHSGFVAGYREARHDNLQDSHDVLVE